MGLKVGYRKVGTTISYMRLYCSSTFYMNDMKFNKCDC